MKITLLPQTKLGQWSVNLMISSWVLFLVGSFLSWKPGYSGFEIVIQNPLQVFITFLMLFIGIATAGMAYISIFRNKERSVSVFLAIPAGLYSILGFVGSFVNVFFNS
jgi:predicted membrane channel-forming protein YqfA (hemolysin III family)